MSTVSAPPPVCDIRRVFERAGVATVTLFFPSTKDVLSLQVGDLAPSCFGKPESVSNIFARGTDIHGKAYVCYYTRSATGLTVSHSMKEDEVVRSVDATRHFTSAELDRIESEARIRFSATRHSA